MEELVACESRGRINLAQAVACRLVKDSRSMKTGIRCGSSSQCFEKEQHVKPWAVDWQKA